MQLLCGGAPQALSLPAQSVLWCYATFLVSGYHKRSDSLVTLAICNFLNIESQRKSEKVHPANKDVEIYVVLRQKWRHKASAQRWCLYYKASMVGFIAIRALELLIPCVATYSVRGTIS